MGVHKENEARRDLTNFDDSLKSMADFRACVQTDPQKPYYIK